MTYPLVKFGDVVRQVKDKVDPQTADLERYVAGEHMDTDNLHIRRWGDIGNGYLGPAFHMRFKPGQVLYGSRRTYLRKVAVAEFEGITANTTYVLEPKDPDVLLPELLPFIMQTDSFNEHSIKQSKGSVNPYINFSDITWYEFPLPPLDEQRRIADLLWGADDVEVNYAESAKAAKKLLVRSCLDWTNKPEWKIFTMQECSENLDNFRAPLNQEVRAGKQGDIPYYGANGIIDYIDDFVFDEEVVLLGEDGDHFYKWQDWKQSQLTVGKSWVNNHAHVFKAKTDICSNRWLYRHFQHRNLTGLIQDSASMTRRKLTKAMLLNIRVPIPTLEEQEEIVGKIDEIEKTYEQLLEHLETCKRLRKEILNKRLG
jgi:type I restriction enzyme, S subunit